MLSIEILGVVLGGLIATTVPLIGMVIERRSRRRSQAIADDSVATTTQLLLLDPLQELVIGQKAQLAELRDLVRCQTDQIDSLQNQVARLEAKVDQLHADSDQWQQAIHRHIATCPAPDDLVQALNYGS